LGVLEKGEAGRNFLADKGNIFLTLPLDRAYPALAGQGTCRPKEE
jgi:hypothetical protein